MIEIFGNILRPSTYRSQLSHYGIDAICITTNCMIKKNGELVMGAGLAKEAANMFPSLPLIFGNIIKNRTTPYKSTLIVLPWQNNNTYDNIIAFPTKIDWKELSSIKLIQRGLTDLSKLAIILNWKTVIVPLLGCKNGGLNPVEVKELLYTYLDDRFYLINRK